MPGICTNRCDITTLEPHKRPRFVPGEPAESELYLRTASEFAEDRIPPYNAGIDLRYPCRLSPQRTTARSSRRHGCEEALGKPGEHRAIILDEDTVNDSAGDGHCKNRKGHIVTK